VCIQTVPIPLHLLQTAEMLNSSFNCGITVFVIMFNKTYLKNCRWHTQKKMEKPILLFSGDFKRSAENSFVVATSDSCLCSRLTCEYTNGRDAIVASTARLLPHHVWTRLNAGVAAGVKSDWRAGAIKFVVPCCTFPLLGKYFWVETTTLCGACRAGVKTSGSLG